MLVLCDEYRAQFPELYSGISELVKSFQLFHRLMLTSREMFKRADLLMQTFAKQQHFLVNFKNFKISKIIFCSIVELKLKY